MASRPPFLLASKDGAPPCPHLSASCSTIMVVCPDSWSPVVPVELTATNFPGRGGVGPRAVGGISPLLVFPPSTPITSYPMWPTEVVERPGAGAWLPAPHTMMRGANAQPTALVSGRGSNPSRVGHEGKPGPVVHSRRPMLPRGGGRTRNCFGGSNLFDIFLALRSGCNSSISNPSIYQ